ncbi:MAG: hypothetical protein IPG81_09340 [Sandaracinaceae bacterium]|nr:hypothetical protein [Sandaracinaceae bacterium]
MSSDRSPWWASCSGPETIRRQRVAPDCWGDVKRPCSSRPPVSKTPTQVGQRAEAAGKQRTATST